MEGPSPDYVRALKDGWDLESSTVFPRRNQRRNITAIDVQGLFTRLAQP